MDLWREKNDHLAMRCAFSTVEDANEVCLHGSTAP